MQFEMGKYTRLHAFNHVSRHVKYSDFLWNPRYFDWNTTVKENYGNQTFHVIPRKLKKKMLNSGGLICAFSLLYRVSLVTYHFAYTMLMVSSS